MRWSRAAGSAESFADGRAVVGLRDPDAAAAVAADHGLTAGRVESRLRAMEVTASPAQLRALAAAGDPRVRYVEAPPAIRFLHRRDDPYVNLVDSRSGKPYEWTFTQLGVDRAFNLGRGSPQILVGVVDSGLSSVPDLQGKVVQTFWDPAVTSAEDPLGHGTFVSSLIAANDDDGIGMAGFCGACRLLVYRIRAYFDASAAIVKLVDQGVRVINLSIGGDPGDPSFALTDAVNYAAAHGVLVVAAAGNVESDQVDYPAAQLQPPGGQPGIGLAVGASDAGGTRTSWSNYGEQLSLLAPGGYAEDSSCLGIFGAVPQQFGIFDAFGCDAPLVDPATGGRYAYGEGTSFSTPEVVGIAALAWAAAPTLTSADLVRIITQTATRPAGTGWTPDSGWGVVNAARVLETVTGRSSADGIQVTRASSRRGRRPRAGCSSSACTPPGWTGLRCRRPRSRARHRPGRRRCAPWDASSRDSACASGACCARRRSA
jgi:serine protease